MNVRPMIRYGELSMYRHPPVLSNPATWDRNMTTFALLTQITSNLSIKMEYYIMNEITGGNTEIDATTNETIDNTFVKDNQFLLQMKFEF